jgi:hypothetical protein
VVIANIEDDRPDVHHILPEATQVPHQKTLKPKPSIRTESPGVSGDSMF